MNNEWKMVPVEPTKEQTLAVCMHPDLARALYSSMLAAAPVPPAGDVEVLGYHWYSFNGTQVFAYGKDAERPFRASALVDRAHITRLTAERDGLQERCDMMHKQLSAWQGLAAERLDMIDALQSELTKALELLTSLIANRDASENICNSERARVRVFLAHQSAPAAKGGE